MTTEGLKIRIVVFVTIGVTMDMFIINTAPQEQNLNLYNKAIRAFILMDAMYKQKSASLC